MIVYVLTEIYKSYVGDDETEVVGVYSTLDQTKAATARTKEWYTFDEVTFYGVDTGAVIWKQEVTAC